jgi:hypothetical protein
MFELLMGERFQHRPSLRGALMAMVHAGRSINME